MVPTNQMQDSEPGADQGQGPGQKNMSKRGQNKKKNTPSVVIMGGRNFWGEGENKITVSGSY